MSAIILDRWQPRHTKQGLLEQGRGIACCPAQLAHRLLLAGHVEVLEHLVAAGADLAIRNGKAWTAVHSAASAGHFEAVLRLVQGGAAWRPRPDLDVIKLLTRKTSLK